jgi:hypothetical protein
MGEGLNPSPPFTMKNYVHENHIAMQLKLKNHSSTAMSPNV